MTGLVLFASLSAFSQGPISQPAPSEPNIEQLFRGVCSGCHELDRIKTQHLSREAWRGLTKGMIDEGNALTKDEVELLLDYLTRNFGPEPQLQGQQESRGN